MTDVGLTHVALVVTDIERSIDFYGHYCDMRVVHDRTDLTRVVWLSDLTRPFVIVLVEGSRRGEGTLGPFGHLGIGCSSRADVDRLTDDARRQGMLVSGPTDSGPPVGYWALLRDPDGNTVELAHGQEVGLTVVESLSAKVPG